MALVSIRRRRIQEHRAWMIRSYAVIFTAVTFRAWVAIASFGLPFDQWYAAGSWTAWLINLLFAELLLGAARQRRRVSQAAPASQTS
jgi:hypothetical protein